MHGPIALAVFISRCKPAGEGARVHFFTAESAVRSVFGWNFSRGPPPFRRWKVESREKENRSTGDNNDEKCVSVAGRRM